MNRHLLKLIRTFLAIGSTSFGGYMSLIAMVKRELVDEKKIIADDVLTEGVSLASFLPGPVAVNVVAFIGYKLSGLLGALVSIVAVLLPSFVLVCGLAIFYFDYSGEVSVEVFFIGIIPVIIANICFVGFSLFKKNCSMWQHYLIVALSFVSLFLISGYWAIVGVIVLAGLLGIILEYKSDFITNSSKSAFPKLLIAVLVFFSMLIISIELWASENLFSQLFIQFSRVSLTLFGGGYVMVPILKSLLVDQLSWVTYQDFMVGISVGQITPGPILISAAFFGYKMAGITGAAVATIGIFLPSSLLMVGASEIYFRIKNNRLIQAALTGIKPAVVGLIFFSAFILLKEHLVNNSILVSLLIVVVSFFVLLRWNIHIIWILLVAGVLGFFLNQYGGF
jgi:chromate transporter